MWKKAYEYIIKDVENENEVKTYAISLRLNLLALCAYLAFSLAVDIGYRRFGLGVFDGAGAVLCAWLFHKTYHNSTRLVSYMINAFILVMIVVRTLSLGNTIHAMNLIYVQIILLYVLDYLETKWKLFYIGVMLVIRFLVSVYLGQNSAFYAVSANEILFWQAVHMAVLIFMLVFSISVATQDFRIMQRKLVSYNKKLQNIASVDPLTGLQNRRSMRKFLEEEAYTYKNGGINALSVAIGDIDFFKKINDTYGHNCGDVVLKGLADIFQKFMIGKGSVARWGGEEFLFVFSNINGDDASFMLTELRGMIKSKRFYFEGKTVKLSMTFGVSEYDLRGGADVTIKEADEKLYMGKERGRDRIIY